MKKKFLIAALVLTTVSCLAQKVTLKVNLTGFKSDTGMAKVGLYNSEGTFLKLVLKRLESKITNSQAQVVFEGLDKGEYAISAYQDENSNGILDKNLLGIPEEDYAASNNAKGFMGPPKYENAKFNVTKNSKITIQFNN